MFLAFFGSAFLPEMAHADSGTESSRKRMEEAVNTRKMAKSGGAFGLGAGKAVKSRDERCEESESKSDKASDE